MGQGWWRGAVYGLLLMSTACVGTPAVEKPSRTGPPSIAVVPLRDPPVALRKQLESGEPARTEDGELIATGAAVGGVIGYAIGSLAALSCIMVPGCAPAIAMAPAIIGGAASGAVIMGVATEVSKDRDSSDKEPGQDTPTPPGLVSNKFQQALALHTYQVLETASAWEPDAGLETVDSIRWQSFLEEGHPRAGEILDQGLADRVLTVGITTLSLDNAGRLRLNVSTSLRELDASRGISSYRHGFVVLERRTASEWLAGDGRHLADVLVRSLPYIANRLVDERFLRVGSSPAVQPSGELPTRESVQLRWVDTSAPDRDRRGVDIILREGRAQGQCADWLARVGRRNADNIDPPCLLSYQAGSLRAVGQPGEGSYTLAGLSPCTIYSWAARDRLAARSGPAVSEWSDWREFSTRCE